MSCCNKTIIVKVNRPKAIEPVRITISNQKPKPVIKPHNDKEKNRV